MGAPVVTLPRLQQGQSFTAGLYKRMGITDAIADTTEEYIQLAIKIAKDDANDNDDRQFGSSLRANIRAQNHKLFEDTDSVDEWRKLLVALGSESSIEAWT